MHSKNSSHNVGVTVWIVELFRLLLPRWKFFDCLGPSPQVEFRWIDSRGQWSDWTVCFSKEERSRAWAELFWSPQDSCHLLVQSRVERLLELDSRAETAGLLNNPDVKAVECFVWSALKASRASANVVLKWDWRILAWDDPNSREPRRVVAWSCCNREPHDY